LNFITCPISGEHFNLLDKRGLLNDTLIIITSDHGEEFFEHDGYDHKSKPYDEIIRVPLIIYKKDENFSQTEKSEEAEKLVSLIDLAPSISQYLYWILSLSLHGETNHLRRKH